MKFSIFLILLLHTLLLFAGDFTNYDTSNSGLAGNKVKAVVVDANGNKWFGTDQGLSAFDGVNWVVYVKDDQKQTLADNDINDLAFDVGDRGPELWIATANGVSVMGIASIDAVTKATPYRVDNTDLIDNMVTAAAVDTLRGERWFGTPKGVSRFSASGWRNFDMNSTPPLAWSNVTAIGVDADSGWKYICTKGGGDEMNGVSRLRTTMGDVDAITAPSPYNYEWSGLLSMDVYAVFVDADGAQWFGTDAGFAYHDTTETKAYWDVFTTEEGLIDDNVRAILKSDDGMAWIGTLGGLDRFDYQFGEYGIETWKFTHFTTADGLAGDEVYDIAQDLDGTLWIATNNGVSHYTGKTAVEKQENAAVKSFGLVGNYPNPFNPATTITYRLAAHGHVRLMIVNMRGERVRTLVSTNQSRGRHRSTWNGRLTDGRPAPTGIYMVVLDVASDEGLMRDSIKMLLVR